MNDQNNNTVALYREMGTPLQSAITMGEFFSKSGMFGCQKTEQGIILALACMFENKSPLDIKRTYHLIDGELSKRSDAMLAEFNALGGEHDIISQTPDEAAVKLTLKGKSHTFRLTWTEAQIEPFVNDSKGGFKKNYRTPRARMQTMWARVISQGVRTMAPGVVAGTYTPEEIEDFAHEGRNPKQGILQETKTDVVTTQTSAAPKQTKIEPPIIDVTPEPTKQAPNPEPVKTPTTQPVPPKSEDTKPSQAESATPGRLSAETMTKLQAAITEKHWQAAEEYLVAKKFMQSNCGDDGRREGLWFTLNPVWANRIIDNPQSFFTKALGITL